MERADFVDDTEHDAGSVASGRWWTFAAEDEEAGRIGGVILDVVLQDRQAVFGRGENSGDGPRVLFPPSQLGRASVGRSFDQLHLRQVAMQPDATLGQGLRMDVEPLQPWLGKVRKQT